MKSSRGRLLIALTAVIGVLTGVMSLTGAARAATPADPPIRVSAKVPTSLGVQAQVVVEPPFPLNETFALHSRPGAKRVIYLDFDGETLISTGWNDEYGLGTINGIGFDTDSLPATFSDSERTTIQSVWQRVSEDYAPFAVDVTTENPGFDAIHRTNDSDDTFGTRALITNMTTGYNLCSCGGVGYIGVFDTTWNHARYQPALVFQRGSGNTAKGIAEVVSHEVGHNLGLDHDGTSSSSYYSGQGAWAPIMGSGYSKPLSQFGKGEYNNADNTEDDLSIIQSYGAPLATDDVGNTPGTATATSAGQGAGVISTDSDVDVFSFAASGGSVTVAAAPAPVGPNLDVKLEVLDGSGTVLATADPASARVSSDVASGIDASITTTLPAGTYYARVQGVGSGNPATDGYSGYGSLGRYSLAVSGAVGVTPVANVSDVVVSEGHIGTTNATFTVNLSTASANPVSLLASTGDGTAAAGSDYGAAVQLVVVPAGQTSATFPVSITGDRVPEVHENFTVTLTSPSGATIGDGTGLATVVNDDGVGVSVSDVDQNEGSLGLNVATFTVSLSTKPTTAVSVLVSTGNGTAKSLSDYAPVSKRIYFAKGEQFKTVSVYIGGDKTVEPNESYALWLSAPSGLVVTDAMGVGTIRNDD